MTTHFSEVLPTAYLEVNADGAVEYANSASSHLFGKSADSLVGKRFVQLFLPGRKGSAEAQALLERVTANPKRAEISFLHGDGSKRFCHVFAAATRDGSEAPKIRCTLVDVTEEHNVQAKFEEAEARFRALADSAPVMLWMSGMDGRCTLFNQQWLDFTGRTLEEELGEGWAEGVHPEDFQPMMETYLGAFVERRPFRMEYRLRRADGQFRWILDTGLPRRTPEGTFAGFIGSCIDITELRQATDVLRRLKSELEVRVQEAQAAIAVRDEFLSVASHELRTPLSALVLQLDGLRRNVTDAERRVESGRLVRKVESAYKATQRVTKLVDKLLDVSRAATGHLTLTPEECDLAEVARDLTERMSETAQRAGCDLTRRIDESIHGYWDRTRLEQILENLLSNAIKYGSGKPIEVTVKGSDSLATISVKDGGIGISKGDLSRIFERFERAVSSRHYGGLGLGLYIARQIAEAHGGRIRCDSEQGAGAVFEVELPRRPSSRTTTEGSESIS